MNNSWLNLTTTQIKEQVRNLAKQELNITHLRPQGVLTAIIEFTARVTAWLYSTILHPLNTQTTLTTATGTFLDSWGVLLGVQRIQPSHAVGEITIITSKNTTIPKGTTVSFKGTNITYQTIETQTINGEDTLRIIATQPGTQSNALLTTYTIHFATYHPNIVSLTLHEGWNITPGTDIETDISYRKRIQAQWLRNAAGDVPLLYEAEAQTIPAVIEAKIIRTPNQQFGTTHIIIRTASQDTPPTQTLLTQVDTHLRSIGLVARDLQVQPVTILPLAITCTFSGTLSQDQAHNRILQYIISRKIGQKYTIQDLYNLFDDQDNIQFITPTIDDTTLDERSIYNPTIQVTKETS